ncbi:hypothetical protein TRAPUB_8477 [Trametes pubescens]|uniref:F-box domain-containing protein n=1 Tax=Trametes pubescens TaxID=154538 RepID=A0A1M2W585_TRAPU|nr:hypothetical protein TRAPUB_8477 [Trametes pubescens]
MVGGPGASWENMSDVKQLRPLTAVCHTWRMVAIGTPSLWPTALVCQTPDQESPWYKLCLASSGQGYLDVFADLATRRGVTKFLMQHGARVRSLCLVYPENQDSMRYGPMQLALPLPNLERCTISEGLIERTSTIRHPSYALFPNSPRLSMLRLLSCDFLPSQPFPALSHLCVMKCAVRLEDLLNLISQSPQLQVLKLYLNGPDRWWIDVPSLEAWRARPRRVSPQLRELEIVDYLPVLNWNDVEPNPNHTIWYNVLSSVTVPLACVTRIGAISSEHLTETLDRLHVGSHATHAYLTKRWTYCQPSQCGFSLHALNQEDHLDVVLGVLYDQSIPEHTLHSHLSSAFASFTALRRLWVRLDTRLTLLGHDTLARMLAALPALEFLALFASDATRSYLPCTELLPMSGLAPAPPRPGTPNAALRCPRLATLVLNPRGWPCAAPASGQVAYARTFARARAAAGAPLTRLLLCESEQEPGLEQGLERLDVFSLETVDLMRMRGLHLSRAGARETVLREYDAAGARVRTHDGDAYVVAERMWAEGIEWSGPEGEWTQSFR